MLILTPLFFVLVLVLLHSLAARTFLSKIMNRVTMFMLIGIPLTVVYAYTLYGSGIEFFEILSLLLMFALLCELYIFIFTMTIGSVSTNILLSLLKGDLSDSQLSQKYNSHAMVSNRVERLISIGLLCENDHLISLTPKGKRLAQLFIKFKKFFRHTT